MGVNEGLSTNFADHNKAFGLWVLHKLRQHIDKVGSIEGVTTDADNSGLAQSVSGGLVDSFIGEGA